MNEIKMRKTDQHTIEIDGIKHGVLEIPGVVKLRPSMILAACYNAVTRAFTLAIDKAGLPATARALYGQIDVGVGTRVQYAAALSNDHALIGGAQGFIAAIGSAIGDVAECFARMIDQTTGSTVGNMFFTPIGAGDNFEMALVNRRTGQATNLSALGFTQVVAVSALGGLVGVRALDTKDDRNRRLYFLSFAKLSAGAYGIERWNASNPLATAIQGLPWRVTAQNIGQVLVRTADGFESVSLKDLGTCKIVSLAEQAIAANTTHINRVLGETVDPSQVVVADTHGNTHFVPAPSFRAAVEQVQQAQPTA